jgi:hypothetical protein
LTPVMIEMVGREIEQTSRIDIEILQAKEYF